MIQTDIKRSKQLTQNYFQFLDTHIMEVALGKATSFMQINQIAKKLFVSHQHLTDTVQQETGNHPCHFYDLKIIEQAKWMLIDTNYSISEIARFLTYDPSNFLKFFKKLEGKTPGQFRKENGK